MQVSKSVRNWWLTPGAGWQSEGKADDKDEYDERPKHGLSPFATANQALLKTSMTANY
jgi:hypothetical protein